LSAAVDVDFDFAGVGKIKTNTNGGGQECPPYTNQQSFLNFVLAQYVGEGVDNSTRKS